MMKTATILTASQLCAHTEGSAPLGSPGRSRPYPRTFWGGGCCERTSVQPVSIFGAIQLPTLADVLFPFSTLHSGTIFELKPMLAEGCDPNAGFRRQHARSVPIRTDNLAGRRFVQFRIAPCRQGGPSRQKPREGGAVGHFRKKGQRAGNHR